jgi:hypothetical protein
MFTGSPNGSSARRLHAAAGWRAWIRFNIEGKTLPAGQYEFFPDVQSSAMRVVGAGKGSSALAMIVTRMAAEIHTTPNDAHVVFDKVGDVYTLSEVWVPGQDGYMLNVTKGKHEHRTVNVPK